MNVFFDVDGTLISEHGGLRPHVREVFQRLKEAGHSIYIWSGAGIRWEVVRANRLEDLVSGCYPKPLSDHKNGLAELGVRVYPDFCVDDYGGVVHAFGGVIVSPYSNVNAEDTEMLRVLESILSHQAAPVRTPTGGQV